jgi:ribosomal protein L40E
MSKADKLQQAITVQRDENEPEAVELIAKAIIDIADAHERMRTVLTRRALVLLVRDISGVGIHDIEQVLDAVPKLRTYLAGPLPSPPFAKAAYYQHAKECSKCNALNPYKTEHVARMCREGAQLREDARFA